MAVLEAKAIITADDRTGAAFAAIEARIAHISSLFGEVSKVSASVGRLSGNLGFASEFERASQSVAGFSTALAKASGEVSMISQGFAKVPRHVRQAAKEVGVLSRALEQARHMAEKLGPMVTGGAGLGILESTKKATEAGAGQQGQRAKMGVAGIGPSEVAQADMQSAILAARYPNVSRAQILETYKETRSVLLNADETPGMMPTVIGAKSAMNALDSSGHLSEGLGFAIKGAEISGRAQNPERLKAYLDSFIRAQQVMGKTITPEQQYDFAKYLRTSGVNLSDRFAMTTGVSLSQEMGGSSAGNAIDMFEKQIVGGFQGNNHAAAKEFIALGLANKDDFEETKNSGIAGMKHGRKVVGADLAASDPDLWVYQHLIPAMEKAGITKPEDQIAETRRLFPSKAAADAVAKLISQRESFENHAKLYGEAAGIPGGETLMREDPAAALNALGTALTTFGGTLTSPIMKDAAAAMSSLASGIGAFGAAMAKFQTDAPQLSKWIAGGAITGGLGAGGALVSGLATGFGLTGSATALTGSAAALDAAAAHLGGGVPGAPGAAPGKGDKPSIALPFLQYWLWGVGEAAIQDGISSLPHPAFPKGYTPKTELDKSAWDKFNDLRRSLYPYGPTESPGGGTYHMPPSGYAHDYSLGYTGGFAKSGTLVPPGGLGYVSDYTLGHVAPGPIGQGFDPNLLSGKIEANLKPDQVIAKVDGQVQGSITIKVEASDLLKAAVAQASGGQDGNFRMDLGPSRADTDPRYGRR